MFDSRVLQHIRILTPHSHKGENGRLLVIGGSHLFHAASLWSLTVASRIVDLVHFSSIDENNRIVHELKKEFRNGIIVSRRDIEDYIQEDDVILIGPGMVRTEGAIMKKKLSVISCQLSDIEKLEDEGEQTYLLTNYLLKKYPEKQWVIDAGALQMVELENIPKHAILTPHHGEFELIFSRMRSVNEHLDASSVAGRTSPSAKLQRASEAAQNFVYSTRDNVQRFAKKYSCIVLLKGHVDIVSNGDQTVEISGGNAGMTKGGTGDVLAGLIAALVTMNDPFISAQVGSFVNKMAGDELLKTVGPFFNATDLANEIPKTMRKLFM